MSWKSDSKVPRHLAIIMDGNGRWARGKGLSRLEGHRVGAKKIEWITEACKKKGVSYLTLYAFSEENWARPDDEVESLMSLAESFLNVMRDSMIEKGVRFVAIGNLEKLPLSLRNTIEEVQVATRRGKDIVLIVALSYGSRQEICRAVNKLLKKSPTKITEEQISDSLDTGDYPDPDLLIRTGGEQRISNYLLWQLAYTELYFTKVLWPNFGEKDLDVALGEYAKRERRFGKLGVEDIW